MKKTITLLAFQCCVLCALMAQPNYENTHLADVQAYMYNMSATPINGNNDETNQLRTGTVIYYKTSEGRWGKMRIQQYDFNLIIEWITYNDNGSTYFSASNFTVRSSYTYDLDLGKEATASNDFWWQCQTHIIRNIVPNNGAQFYKVIYSKKGKKTVTEPVATNPNTPSAEQPKTKEQRKAENVETGLKIVVGLADAFGKKKTEQAKTSEEPQPQTTEPKPAETKVKAPKATKAPIKGDPTTEDTFSATISWQYPLSNNTTTSTPSLELKACVETSETIREYILFQNGQRVAISRGLIPRKANDCLNVFHQTVTLKNGENTFQLVAQMAKGEVKSDVFNIIFDKNSRPTEPIATETKIEKRIALVIGNADYTEGSKLKNPVNDANLITQTLKSLGFRVMQFNNLKKTDFERAIRDFSVSLADYNVALFYYAGHGVQVDGENYLLPVDAKLQDKRDVRFEAVKVRFAIEEFENHPDNVNIVILDACRNNPFRSWARGGSEGFKPMNIGGTLVAFATAADATASDGSGSNGLYTEELAKQMLVNQPIEAVFRETRKAVLNRSSRSQNPQEWSQLTQSFYFKK